MKNTITMKDCNKALLQTIIKQMVIVDKYVNLRICDTFTDSSSYLTAHDVVKYIKVNNSKIFSNEYQLDKPIRMSFIMGTKLLVLLSQFENDNTIDLEISYDDKTDADEYYAIKVTLIGKDLSISEICADQRFDSINIKPIPDDTMQSLLDKTDCSVSFNMSKDDMKSIKALGNIDKESKRFEYIISDGMLSIQERSDVDDPESVIYSKNITEVNSSDKTYLCNKNVFSVINNTVEYDVYICEGDVNKVIYTHDENNMSLNIIASI